jgi:hypothetical protein
MYPLCERNMEKPISLSEYVKLHLVAMATASEELQHSSELPPLQNLESVFVNDYMLSMGQTTCEDDEFELSKFEVLTVIRATLQSVCRLLNLKEISDPSCPLRPYLEALRHEFDTGYEVDNLPQLKELRDRTEPELREYFNGLMNFLKSQKPDDVTGFVLLAFQSNNITQYASSVDPGTIPAALREVANRIESRDTVTRP